MPSAQKPRRPGWVVPVVAALAVALLATGGLAVWALTRPNGVPTPTGSSSATTFTLYGDVTLTTSRGVANLSGAQCEGMGGFDDLRSGTDVTVYDAAGVSIGVGELGTGQLNDFGANRTCVFPFAVDNVPTGRGFYGIQVSHRGKVTLAETAITTGAAHLEIGT